MQSLDFKGYKKVRHAIQHLFNLLPNAEVE